MNRGARLLYTSPMLPDPSARGGGTRRARSRRWLLVPAVVGVVAVLGVVGIKVVYPRVGASMIRARLTSALGARLGREVRAGSIDVTLGHATIRDLEIRGPRDGERPLVHVARIDVEFAGGASLVGRVRLGAATVDGVTVSVHRQAGGEDNVGDVIARLRAPRPAGASGDGSPRPTSIAVSGVQVTAEDAVTGARARIVDGVATWSPTTLAVQLRGVSATTVGAPKAEITALEITRRAGEPPHITIEGGELSVWPKLALTGIGGTIVADAAHPGAYTVDLSGGYGGVPGRLWTAKGGVDPRARTGAIDLVAARFQLDRLAPLLQSTPVVDYAGTSVDTRLHVAVTPAGAAFAGALTLRGLNIGHPMIAAKDVHGLDLSAQVEGRFDRATRRLELTRGDFVARDLPFSVTGSAVQGLRGGAEPVVVDPKSGEAVARRGPGNLAKLSVRLVIPPIECQRVLAAIPTEMAPYLEGYKLRGTFETDVRLDIDWDNLDTTVLDGSVGLRRCKVVDEPDSSPQRLLTEFEHFVEVEKDEWISFVVGESNPDFVPLDQVSPFLVKSLMTTEDGAFYKHRGFITSEFRTALVSNLKAGRFRHGASSITMQFVKNVLLYREKTLARKLQELFLTWHVENTLTKDRILEIYLNVIEYGPGLYGIGPAAMHYFHKAAKDLTPVEAAFFSTILPSPKERYKQYCEGTLTKWTSAKIARILTLMLKRERLTQVEYDQAVATPLVFAQDDTETPEACVKRVQKAIKNARPTNPLKR